MLTAVDRYMSTQAGWLDIFESYWRAPGGNPMSPEQVLKALDSHRDETGHIEAPPYATD